MFDLLLYAELECPKALDIVKKIKDNEDLSNVIKNELVVTVKEATPSCNWDAND
jgi:hypothetical protein